MNEKLIQFLVTLFFAGYFATYLVSQLIILGFSYEDAEEKRWLVLRSIPLNLLVNTLFFLAVTTLIFGGRNSFSDLLDILRVSRSYRDISRLALSATACLCFSAIWPLIACRLYNRHNGGTVVRGRQKAAVLLLIAAAFVPFMAGLRIGASELEHLEISAVCRETAFPDGLDAYGRDTDGESCSYVEIHNASPLSCEIDRLWLSDDPDALRYASIRDQELAPYGTYRLVMTGDNSLNIRGTGGTTLYLSDAEGNILDKVVVPTLREEEALCRTDGEWSIVDLIANERRVFVPVPLFSADSGVYHDSFYLSLSAEEGLTVYYTLDSAAPDENATPFDKDIYIFNRSILSDQYRSIENIVPDYKRTDSDSTRVQKATVVRAVAADENGNLSDVVTKTYFVGLTEEDFGGRQLVSLVADPDDLFGENGIYITGAAYDAWYDKALTHLKKGEELDTADAPLTNYQQQGMDWEREANIELFSGGRSVLSQPIGIRIQGNTSRHEPLKRFSLFAREEYSGSDWFNMTYPEGIQCHSLLLRPGDLFAVSQLIAQGTRIDTLTPTPVAVFLDGEFWYNAYLYEKFDERNLAAKYDISKDNVAIVKNEEIPPEASEGEMSVERINELYGSLSPDDPDVCEKLGTVIDIDSFIDELCIQCYLGNVDVREYWNNLVWHSILPTGSGADDSRWRWGLVDADLKWEHAAELHPDGIYSTIDPFITNGTTHTPVTEWRPYVLLRGNESFRTQLMDRFMELVNSSFYIPRVLSILDGLGIEDESIREFFENRLYYLVPRMAEEFGRADTVGSVELGASEEGTPISVNGMSPELVNKTKWTGFFLTDEPLILSTDREDLFFWMVTAEGETQLYDDPTIEIPLTEGGVKVYALFK